MGSTDSTVGGARPGFPATDLRLLQQLLQAPPEARRAALEGFCKAYWRPVYFHIRLTWSKSREDAKDLTQAFFLWMMEDETLRRYSSGRGSLRNFIKVLLRQFILDHDKAQARVKRGGRARTVPIDDGVAQTLRGPAPLDPERERDRLWVETLIDRAIKRVRSLFAATGRAQTFRAFEEYELAGRGRMTYAEVAGRLGVKESDVRNRLFAAREAIREKVLADLRRRSTDEDDFQRKVRELFDA